MAIDQYRNCIQDGRLEFSEVMASGLSEDLLSRKERTLTDQGHLVTVLRDLACIYEIRNKWKDSRNTAPVLSKARKQYVKLLKKNDMIDAAKDAAGMEAEDEVQRGRVRAHEGKLRNSLSHYKRALKIKPLYIEAAYRQLEAHEQIKSTLKGAGKSAIRLSKILGNSGPVTRSGESFELRPDGAAVQLLDTLIIDIERWLTSELELPRKSAEMLSSSLVEIKRQMVAIEAGEQAANERLQSAIDSLVPAVDYHTYSRGS